MTKERPSISVTAQGEATVAPDLAIVSFAVTGEGKELGRVRDDANRRTSAVLAALRDLGLADGDIDAPAVAVNPQYDYRKGQQLIGYQVTRTVVARVRDLDRLGPVLDGIVAAGANQVYGVQMSAAGLRRVASGIDVVARAEGLVAHARSVAVRLEA